MGIKRNKLAEPQWESFEYAKIDKENLFSYDLWKHTINWNLLLEHIKKTEGACQMINEYIYPSRLFTAYIDILEANMCILNDIVYYEIGIHPTANTKETWFILATHYLRFWNMDWYKEMKMIYDGLHRIENHLLKCLKQNPLLDIADEVFKKSNYAKAFQITPREPSDDIFNKCSYSYACDAYRDSETDKNTLVEQILNIVNTIETHKMLLDYFININESAFSSLNCECLVKMFRQSGKGENFIKPWRRDYEGSRDSLIAKMEKDPELGSWVNRYTHLREGYNEKTTIQLFCDDDYNIKNIEETFNTDNWIRLLTIAAVLQEYDEQHAQPAKKPAMKAKAPSPFTDFIIDTPRSEAVLKRLHEIIDGKKPKVCALTILAAAQSGILMQPTYRAVFSEFPEIGDRKNYEYYLQRKDNYSDDIDSIAKGF